MKCCSWFVFVLVTSRVGQSRDAL